MRIVAVHDVLSPAGLKEPELNVLAPTQGNYSAMFFQPEGNIEVTSEGVRHADRTLADNQFGAFIRAAVTDNVDLAVTPEYSMPWDTLGTQLSAGSTPRPGSVWVFGCESITLSELKSICGRLAPDVQVIYEDLDEEPNRFLNPVAYVFVTQRTEIEDSPQLVMLVQFKSCPMRHADDIEVNGMQKGTRLYCFGNMPGLRMATLICSDAFAFLDEHARELYDRTLILHIQLNPKPRQEQFRQYRDRLMQFGGGQTELICLNWARNVRVNQGDPEEDCWHNIGGSAWYLNPSTFDDSDTTLAASHSRGLYYTWLHALRCHTMFFNYRPAVFTLIASKVAHIGVAASLSYRRGPQLSDTRTWDRRKASWTSQPSLDDEFANAVAECGGAESDVSTLADANPFHAERVLALSVGQITEGITWYTLQSLDSCSIEASEVVRRMTVCQDPDATAFRETRLRRCARLHSLLLRSSLPAVIADLGSGFELDWTPQSPHQNVVSSSGNRATVIYLSDTCNENQAKVVVQKADEYLRRSFSDQDKRMAARQRLQVWYRDSNGDDVIVNAHAHINYDEPRNDSRFDIARSE